MDISIRNGIVLENILQYVDVQGVMNLSAVCKRWYEQINNDTLLWSRLVQLEQIEDPEYWYRIDDNDQWTLGTPCKPKNILINYRRTYYCFKHNIYKKYEFNCDNNNVFEYDGKTLLFTLDNELNIYKVINNSFELFQKIDLSAQEDKVNPFSLYDNFEFVKGIIVFNNDEFIIIIRKAFIMISYRFEGNKYVVYNQRSLDDTGRWWGIKSGKLLNSNLFIGTVVGAILTVVVWNILENKIIFNAPNHKFIKYDNGTVYTYHTETKKLVLYNENFEIIYIVDQSFEFDICEVIANDELLYVVYYNMDYDIMDNSCSISIWNKTNGQINMGSMSFHIDDDSAEVFNVFTVNKNIIITFGSRVEPLIECYDTKFQLLWSYCLPSCNRTIIGDFIFNKLLIIRENRQSNECIIEFRDVNNGDVLFSTSTELFENFWKVNKDTMIFGRHLSRKKTVLLYR